MDVIVRKSLKAKVDEAFKVFTEQKSQEEIYAKLPGSDVKIKREGRAPSVKLKVSRKMPANAPGPIKRLVPPVNEVTHTEEWKADGDGYSAKIAVDIKGVPVQFKGTKTVKPDKGGSVVEWKFVVTSGVPLLGGIVAAFGAEQLKGNLEDEYRVVKGMF
jgi:hypothetical protein